MSALEVLVNLDRITIDFPIYGMGDRSIRSTLVKSLVGGKLRASHGLLKVTGLDNVSFTLNSGDRLGISGHNGSGKTTLLRLLSGAYAPTYGRLTMRGRVVSFIDIMLGMDLEFTGIENIFIRGMFYGLTKNQIRSSLDDIVSFSGLGDFINLPMRTYSSGMMMRLAFSIATSIETDIILMDEWLSVGDASFSDLAQARLDNYLKNVEIAVIASHSPDTLNKNCNKRIELTSGAISQKSWSE